MFSLVGLKRITSRNIVQRVLGAILGDGSVVTWGDARCGGDSAMVQDKLHDVQQIQATRGCDSDPEPGLCFGI